MWMYSQGDIDCIFGGKTLKQQQPNKCKEYASCISEASKYVERNFK